MRVLLVASSFPRSAGDWRSRFILDMLHALAEQRGPEDALSYWGPPGPLPGGVRFAATADAAWLEGLIDAGGLAHLLRTRPAAGLRRSAGYLLRLRRAIRSAQSAQDLLHLNWLQNVLAVPSGSPPAVVTVLGSDFGLLRHSAVRLLVRNALARQRCVLAPNAGWMVEPLRRALGAAIDVVPVPFGVAPTWYTLPRNPGRPRRWLVVARLTPAKLGPLFTWGEAIFRGDDELHLLGPMQDSVRLPSWVNYHGPTDPRALQARWFPSATGLITLSVHDEGRPQVLLEAMAAGLAVVASRWPAHEDLIKHGVTGFLVDSANEFQVALQVLADAGVARCIGAAARQWAAERIGTWADTAARYRVIYRRLMEAAG